ncbi:Elongin-B, partial [Taenia solium]
DIFLAVRRKKTTIFLSLKENAEVLEVKQMIEGILKVPPEDQVLLYGSTAMYDHKPLSYYGLTDLTARAHNPAVLGLCLRDSEGGQFEPLDITPYSKPPELPEVMRCQENQPPRNTSSVGVSATNTTTAAAANQAETAAASRPYGGWLEMWVWCFSEAFEEISNQKDKTPKEEVSRTMNR